MTAGAASTVQAEQIPSERWPLGSVRPAGLSVNAKAFYQRQGFTSVGRGIFSHGEGGDPVEIVYMELERSGGR